MARPTTKANPGSIQEPQTPTFPAGTTDPPAVTEMETGLPGFGPTRAYQGPPRDDLRGHEATAAASPPAGGAGGPSDPSASPNADPIDLPGEERPTKPGRSRGSIAELVDMIWPFIAGAGAAVGEFLHERRTPQPDQNEVWIVTDDELEAFSKPLARIVARRIPDGIAGDSDTADALQAGMVATGYGIRNFRDERWLRRNVAQFPQTNPTVDVDDKAPASAPPAANGTTVPVSDILARQAPGMVMPR